MVGMDIRCKFPNRGDYILFVQNGPFSGWLRLGRVVERTRDDFIYIKTEIDRSLVKLRGFDFLIVSEGFVLDTFGEDSICKLEFNIE